MAWHQHMLIVCRLGTKFDQVIFLVEPDMRNESSRISAKPMDSEEQ